MTSTENAAVEVSASSSMTLASESCEPCKWSAMSSWTGVCALQRPPAILRPEHRNAPRLSLASRRWGSGAGSESGGRHAGTQAHTDTHTHRLLPSP